jgi:hypothetical protein
MDSHSSRLDAIASELVTIRDQLNEQIPESKRAQSAATETLEQLAKRDKEVSDKLKESFTQLETQSSEMRIQSEATRAAQDDIHTVVARQKADLDGVRAEVGTYVRETLASIHEGVAGGGKGGSDSAPHAPRERDAPQLNDPKQNKVEDLTDSMRKAAFVLWRDDLDLHLEGCNEFGMGTPEMLKYVRLHSRIIDRAAMTTFYGNVMDTGRAAGNNHILLRWNMGAADRELYKFLHTKLTVQLKATSVLTCQPGLGVRAVQDFEQEARPEQFHL